MINDSNWYHFVTVIRAWQLEGHKSDDSRCYVVYKSNVLAGPFGDFPVAQQEAIKLADYIKAEIEEKFEEIVLGSRQD